MSLNRRLKSQLPAISTASLPDIVFILLFFFMTVTTMKNTNLLVENTLPNANETKELYPTDNIIEILVGKPMDKNLPLIGNLPKIQLEGKFARVDEIGSYVLSELAKMPEGMQKIAMVSLKVDKTVGMVIVYDIKQELRKVNMLKVNYTTYEGDVFQNF